MTLQELVKALPKINEERKYWFVRTNGGAYYQEFLEDGIIAIGYDKITLSDIRLAKPDDEVSLGKLEEIIRRVYPGDLEYRPRFAATQLRTFAYEIKKGDIVVIPNTKSETFGIGEVFDTPAFAEDPDSLSKDKCPYVKRKKIKWIRTAERKELDPQLHKLIYTQQTVSDFSSLGKYIDQIIGSLYVKGDKANIVLGVESEKEINMKEFFQMGSYLLEITEEFFKEEGLEFDSSNYNARMNIQSPGLLVLTGTDWGGIIMMGLIVISIAGGGFYYHDGKRNVGLKTDGIIEKIRVFLNSNSNRQGKSALLKKILDDLEIKNPEDVIKLIEQFKEDKTDKP